MLKDYQNHIEQLAGIMGVKITQAPGMPGMMYVEERPPRIEIATIDETAYWCYPSEPQAKYFAAMHELGHCFYRHTQGRPPHGDEHFYFDNGVLKSEAQAWDWALANCLDDLKQTTREFALRCFSSYRNAALKRIKAGTNTNNRLGNGDRHHIAFEWDDPYDEFVIKILDTFSGIKEKIEQRV